ncbi:MAG: NAD(P)H-dependent oxidoreductase [Pseudomonadota bacterium]
MTRTILRIDASMRRDGSTTRMLSDEVIGALAPASVVVRDLADGVDLIDEAWIGANFTDPAERTDAQKATLAGSDALVEEVEAADTLVIGVPIYNFGVPAALKAWIDQIARAKRTFKYTENGPVGLLEGKTAYLVVASGGTAAGSEIDFATGYLKHVLGFVGVTDVHVIDASKQGAGADGAIARARTALPALAAA